MNIKRGLIRLWIFGSSLWVLCFLGPAAQAWYNATSHWFAESGIQVETAKMRSEG